MKQAHFISNMPLQHNNPFSLQYEVAEPPKYLLQQFGATEVEFVPSFSTITTLGNEAQFGGSDVEICAINGKLISSKKSAYKEDICIPPNS